MVVVCPTLTQSLGYSKHSLAAGVTPAKRPNPDQNLLTGGREGSRGHSTGLGCISVLCLVLQDVTTQSVMGFDPLPPSDTIYSYTRPERYLSPVPGVFAFWLSDQCFGPGTCWLLQTQALRAEWFGVMDQLFQACFLCICLT